MPARCSGPVPARRSSRTLWRGATVNPVSGVYSFNGVCLADSSSVRASAGVSLLWNSPLGPLRLDIAKALKKESYDNEQLIRFGASTKF